MRLLATAQAVGAKVGGAGFASVDLLGKQVFFITAVRQTTVGHRRVVHFAIDGWVVVCVHFQTPAGLNHLVWPAAVRPARCHEYACKVLLECYKVVTFIVMLFGD